MARIQREKRQPRKAGHMSLDKAAAERMLKELWSSTLDIDLRPENYQRAKNAIITALTQRPGAKGSLTPAPNGDGESESTAPELWASMDEHETNSVRLDYFGGFVRIRCYHAHVAEKLIRAVNRDAPVLTQPLTPPKPTGENLCDDCGNFLGGPGMLCQSCIDIRKAVPHTMEGEALKDVAGELKYQEWLRRSGYHHDESVQMAFYSGLYSARIQPETTVCQHTWEFQQTDIAQYHLCLKCWGVGDPESGKIMMYVPANQRKEPLPIPPVTPSKPADTLHEGQTAPEITEKLWPINVFEKVIKKIHKIAMQNIHLGRDVSNNPMLSIENKAIDLLEFIDAHFSNPQPDRLIKTAKAVLDWYDKETDKDWHLIDIASGEQFIKALREAIEAQEKAPSHE